jgi:hypothetical protein
MGRTKHSYSASGLLLAAFGAALLSGCPARDAGTDSAQGSPSAKAPSGKAGAGESQLAPLAPGWPFDAVGLPATAVAAKLPDSVATGYSEAGELSADGSSLHIKFADLKMDYWYVGFTGGGSPEELKAHFDRGTSDAGLQADSSVNDHQAAGELFQLLYSSAEGDLALRIYQDPQTPAAAEPLYVLFAQKL